MVLRYLFYILRWAVLLYEIALLVYMLYPLFSKVRGPLFQTLARICEPVLVPIRRVVNRYLPRKWQRIDWSPLGAILLCGVARMVINLLMLIL